MRQTYRDVDSRNHVHSGKQIQQMHTAWKTETNRSFYAAIYIILAEYYISFTMNIHCTLIFLLISAIWSYIKIYAIHSIYNQIAIIRFWIGQHGIKKQTEDEENITAIYVLVKRLYMIDTYSCLFHFCLCQQIWMVQF